MIAKRIPPKETRQQSGRQGRPSNIGRLVAYMNDPQNKEERVMRVVVTNCHQENALDAAFEMQAIQTLNTRAESDKTYHLMIAFPPGEIPENSVLDDIEAQLVKALGYGEHQRVSAVHHDTDHLHIHVAINKIHPTKHTIHNPYRDYKTLGEVSERLEIEHGLQRVNHNSRKSTSENRADDMEHHAGIESLLGWIKRECAHQMVAAKTWGELHQIARSNGLELKERGNGLVIVDSSGLGVKASSVARELSKGQLEKKMGRFNAEAQRSPTKESIEKCREQSPSVEKVGKKPPPRSQGKLSSLSELNGIQLNSGNRYEGSPIRRRLNSAELYSEYQIERQGLSSVRSAALVAAQAKKQRMIKAAKRNNKLKRTAIKLMRESGVHKKVLYSLVSKELHDDINKINAQYKKDRDAAYEKYHQRTWADWLQFRAKLGDNEALKVLRTRENRKNGYKNTVGGAVVSTDLSQELKKDNVTKSGTIIYRVGLTAIRDDGELFSISRNAENHGLEAALRMAVQRYGSHLEVNGSNEFKERIVQAAAQANLNITFKDAGLEEKRQLLTAQYQSKAEFTPEQANVMGAFREDALSEIDVARGNSQQFTKLQEQHHERRNQTNRRTTDIGRGIQSSDAALTNDRITSRRESGGLHRTRKRTDKPNIGSVGSSPPPQSKNRLRNLSQLGMVQLAIGGEVLLQGDVSSSVEQQRTQRNNELRWDLHRTGGISSAAIDKYIEERMEKRLKIFDIPNHRRYNASDTGVTKFGGLRQVDGEFLVLLRSGEDVVVIAIDAPTARRMKRLAVGDDVALTDQGTIKMKGMRR